MLSLYRPWNVLHNQIRVSRVQTFAMKIDSHLHVWASEAESTTFPYEVTPEHNFALSVFWNGLF